MGRKPRIFLPGAPFHITARLQHGERLFEGLEDRIVHLVLRSAALERTSVVAYAVMPNHLHLLVIHGPRPLSTLMQPLLRRTALLVQQAHQRRGHVFERRYRERVCLDPEYARNIVAYIHLNPVRAGICTDPVSYPWTSHTAYCKGEPQHAASTLFEAGVTAFLALFADGPGGSATEWRLRYRSYLAWRISADQAAECNRSALPAPSAREGDSAWRDRFGTIGIIRSRSAPDNLTPAERTSLESLATSVVLEDGRRVPLELLRTNQKIPAHVELRRKIILCALAAGYSGHQIGRYLRITTSTVSRVRMAAQAAAMSVGEE